MESFKVVMFINEATKKFVAVPRDWKQDAHKLDRSMEQSGFILYYYANDLTRNGAEECSNALNSAYRRTGYEVIEVPAQM